jgi:uncharacterized membrane protein
LLVAAMVPLMAGLVLWLPLAMLSAYTAYRDIFGAGERRDAASVL